MERVNRNRHHGKHDEERLKEWRDDLNQAMMLTDFELAGEQAGEEPDTADDQKQVATVIGEIERCLFEEIEREERCGQDHKIRNQQEQGSAAGCQFCVRFGRARLNVFLPSQRVIGREYDGLQQKKQGAGAEHLYPGIAVEPGQHQDVDNDKQDRERRPGDQDDAALVA